MPQYIGFRLNDNEYTIPILNVREIINTPSITTLPQSPDFVKGIINIRGGIVPVVDLRQLIAIDGESGATSKIIIITSGKAVFGMLVDSITSVVNIDASLIEPPDGFLQDGMNRVEGVARLDDRLVILLDTNKLVGMEELGMLEDRMIGMDDGAAGMNEQQTVDVTQLETVAVADVVAEVAAKEAASPSGSDVGVTIRDLKSVNEDLKVKFKDDELKSQMMDQMVNLLDKIAEKDFDAVDEILTGILSSRSGKLYKEIGHVTRRLHDSLSDFRSKLDPRIKQMANEDVPSAVDSLEYVIEKTYDAAHKTMTVVEKHMAGKAEFSKQVDRIKTPKAAVKYLHEFREDLDADFTSLLEAQEFQDVTGQAIRKVIDLVNDIETELVGLISSFGVKMDLAPDEDLEAPEKVTQGDVDDLLKDFGF